MDLRGATWRKSSRSGNVGACVEVAAPPGTGGLGAVRDSKNPEGGVIVVPLASIRALVTTV